MKITSKLTLKLFKILNIFAIPRLGSLSERRKSIDHEKIHLRINFKNYLQSRNKYRLNVRKMIRLTYAHSTLNPR